MDKSPNDAAETIRYRFYVPKLCAGECSLSGPEAHHALHVLRVRSGAKVELFDGKGSFALAEVVRTSRSEVFVTAVDCQLQPAINPQVHLCFAVPKGKRLDWLLEKATELAVASLQPVVFSRSVAGKALSASKLQRWEAQCISAAKQSGLNHLPEIRPLITLDEFLASPVGAGHLRIFGDLDASAGGIAEVLREKKSHDITLLVGPEGGFDPDERAAILEAEILPAQLGQTTLRIETAAVALLSVIRAVND